MDSRERAATLAFGCDIGAPLLLRQDGKGTGRRLSCSARRHRCRSDPPRSPTRIPSMNLFSLRLLTWGTIAGSIVSALLLAAGESGLPTPVARRAPAAASGQPPDGGLRLPEEATGAGPRAADRPASGASR
jgi:hypothetical protein